MGCEPKTEEALGKTEFVDHDRWAHSVPGITLANAITTCVILRLLKFDVSPNSHIFLMKDPSWVVIMVLLSVSRKTLSESLPCAFQSAVLCVSLRAIACLVCCFALSYPKKIFTNISSVMRRRVRKRSKSASRRGRMLRGGNCEMPHLSRWEVYTASWRENELCIYLKNNIAFNLF